MLSLKRKKEINNINAKDNGMKSCQGNKHRGAIQNQIICLKKKL